MKRSITFPLLLCSVAIHAQKLDYFKSTDFDNTYAIVGMERNGKLNGSSMDFFINTPEDLAQLKKDWIFTEIAPKCFGTKWFDIYVLKNKKIVSYGEIDLTFDCIMSAEGAFSFNEHNLQKQNQSHPLTYNSQELVFYSVKQYNAFYDSVSFLPSFLFMTEAGKVYEGEFTVTVRKTDSVSNPSIVIGKFSKEISAFAPNYDYSVRYNADDYNSAHANFDSMRFTISGSRKIYDKSLWGNYEVGAWEQSVMKVTSFWRL